MVIILIVNIFLNCFLCLLLFSLCSATVNIVFEKYKIIALSILDGTIISTLSLLVLPSIGSLAIYIVLFSCSSIVLFYPIKLQKTILLELIIFAYILLGWGLNYLLQLVFFNIFKITLKTYFVFGFLRGIAICLLGAVVYFFFKLNYKKKEILDFVYNMEISFQGRRIALCMFLDSGNSLYDNSGSGLPVFVVSKRVIEKKLGATIDTSNCREIVYTTINGTYSTLPILSPDKMILFNKESQKEVKALIGLVDKDFKIYDGLLHSAVV